MGAYPPTHGIRPVRYYASRSEPAAINCCRRTLSAPAIWGHRRLNGYFMPAPENVRVDWGQRDDLEEILAIERESFSDPWPAAAFVGDFDTDWPPLTAIAKSKLVGYICVSAQRREVHVTNLAVRAAWRRRNIGRQLVSAVIGVAARRGFEQMYLDVRPSNTAATALYLSLGFLEHCTRVRYYIKPVEDGLVLARRIAPEDARGRSLTKLA